MVSLANAARHEASLEMAKFLLQIRAVKLNNKEPFTWASGRKSPIYCDNRVTLSYPHVRNFIRQEFVNLIEEHIGPVDAVAGVATGRNWDFLLFMCVPKPRIMEWVTKSRA